MDAMQKIQEQLEEYEQFKENRRKAVKEHYHKWCKRPAEEMTECATACTRILYKEKEKERARKKAQRQRKRQCYTNVAVNPRFRAIEPYSRGR